MLIYVLCRQLSRVAITHFLTSNPPMCQNWGAGGSSQFWQCQDFESAYCAPIGPLLLKHLTICTALYKLSSHFEMYCIALRCHFEMHLTTIPTLRPCTGNSFQVLSWKSRLEQPLVLWLSKSIDIEDLIFISASISSTFPRTENPAEPVHNQ